MARTSTSPARTVATPATVAAPTTPATTAATTAPQGSTSTSVVGTPQEQVAHLAMLAAHGITIVAPKAAWPGWGKAVRVAGNGWSGAAYANRGNVDVRCSQAAAAAIAAAVPGATVRGASANYVRIPFTTTGTPQA